MSKKALSAGLPGSGLAQHARQSRRRRRGNAVIEAALVIPVLLYLSMGMVEFGQYFYAEHTVQAAARDGCRQAILVSGTQSAATTAVANTMSAAGFASSGYQLVFTNVSAGTTISDISTVAAGTPIRSTVTVNFGSVGVRPLGVISATKQLIGITTMVKE